MSKTITKHKFRAANAGGCIKRSEHKNPKMFKKAVWWEENFQNGVLSLQLE